MGYHSMTPRTSPLTDVLAVEYIQKTDRKRKPTDAESFKYSQSHMDLWS